MAGVVNTFIDLGIFLTAYNVLKRPLIPANVCSHLMDALRRSVETERAGGGERRGRSKPAGCHLKRER